MNETGISSSAWRDWGEHWLELRRRILVCLAVFAGSVFLWCFHGSALVSLLGRPARGIIQEFVFIAPAEAFAVYCRVVFLAAFVASFPVVLYQLMAFVAPAAPHVGRRRWGAWFVFALVSFLGGIVFAYTMVLPGALNFLVTFGEGLARPMISLSQYVSFAVAIIFVGGCVFEIPCLMGMLTQVGVLDSGFLRAGRRYAIVGILILSAVLTPTQDALSMILFAVPMILLFEAGILLCIFIERQKKRCLKNT